MQVITWTTKKTLVGYKWRVFTVEHDAQSVELKAGVAPTRSTATRKARKWCLYYRQVRGGRASA